MKLLFSMFRPRFDGKTNLMVALFRKIIQILNLIIHFNHKESKLSLKT